MARKISLIMLLGLVGCASHQPEPAPSAYQTGDGLVLGAGDGIGISIYERPESVAFREPEAGSIAVVDDE